MVPLGKLDTAELAFSLDRELDEEISAAEDEETSELDSSELALSLDTELRLLVSRLEEDSSLEDALAEDKPASELDTSELALLLKLLDEENSSAGTELVTDDTVNSDDDETSARLETAAELKSALDVELAAELESASSLEKGIAVEDAAASRLDATELLVCALDDAELAVSLTKELLASGAEEDTGASGIAASELATSLDTAIAELLRSGEISELEVTTG